MERVVKVNMLNKQTISRRMRLSLVIVTVALDLCCYPRCVDAESDISGGISTGMRIGNAVTVASKTRESTEELLSALATTKVSPASPNNDTFLPGGVNKSNTSQISQENVQTFPKPQNKSDPVLVDATTTFSPQRTTPVIAQPLRPKLGTDVTNDTVTPANSTSVTKVENSSRPTAVTALLLTIKAQTYPIRVYTPAIAEVFLVLTTTAPQYLPMLAGVPVFAIRTIPPPVTSNLAIRTIPPPVTFKINVIEPVIKLPAVATDTDEIHETLRNETAVLTTTPATVYNSSQNNTEQEIVYAGLPIFEDRKAYNLSAKAVPITIIGLCGYPPYNDREACFKLDYISEPLLKCEKEWGRIIFSILIAIAATAIICVNGLIVFVVLKDPNTRSHYDRIKVSLAVADAIIGFLLFMTVLPNSIWIRGLNERAVVEAVTNDVNSPKAIFVGSLLSVTLQASMLHLCFLSIERFLSIKVSFWLMHRKTRSITITLIAIWIASILEAFLPAAAPKQFEYKFQPALLIHLLTLKPKEGSETDIGNEGLIYVMVTVVLPYLVMVFFCIATGVVSYRKLKSSKKFFSKERTVKSAESRKLQPMSSRPTGTTTSTREKNRRDVKPEISVFVTILIMIGAFTVTFIPFIVVMALYVSGVLNCSNYTIPYVIAFYFGLFNSLANGFIYSVRDPRFRMAVKRILMCKDIRRTKSFSSSSSQTTRV